MTEIRSFKDLEVWQLAIALVERCNQVTARFPRDEIFGMTSQIRRSAVSVAANIAERHGRESRQSFIQFLRQAQGSLKELETHLIIVERVKLASDDDISPLASMCDRIGKMIRSLIRVLQTKERTKDQQV